MKALRPAPRRWSGRLAALAAAAALASACDPGVSFRPSDWAHTGPYRWASTAEGLDVEMGELVGRAGTRDLSAELTVHNTALSAVVVAGGRLDTRAGSFRGEAATSGGEGYAVAPGDTRRVSIRFRFDREAGEILLEPVVLTVMLRTASGPREITIPMRKE